MGPDLRIIFKLPFAIVKYRLECIYLKQVDVILSVQGISKHHMTLYDKIRFQKQNTLLGHDYL